jgi:hypothetical protein
VRGLIIAVLAASLLGGCSYIQRNTVAGAGIGAGVGALVGSAAGGPTGGWVGAGIGAVAGAAVGSMVRPEPCFIRDRKGREWQVACPLPPYQH